MIKMAGNTGLIVALVVFIFLTIILGGILGFVIYKHKKDKMLDEGLSRQSVRF